MIWITRRAIRIAVAHKELASIVPLAARLLLGGMIMITAERSKVIQRINTASAPTDDVIDYDSTSTATRHDTTIAVNA